MSNSSGLSTRTGERGAGGDREATAERQDARAEPDSPSTTDSGFLQRGRVRRRLRYLRQLREVQLRDLGGFIVELRRFGRQRPELVEAKIAAAEQTDRELRALERALQHDAPLRELREPGLGGACERCGTIHGSADRFCSSCGRPLGERPQVK